MAAGDAGAGRPREDDGAGTEAEYARMAAKLERLEAKRALMERDPEARVLYRVLDDADHLDAYAGITPGQFDRVFARFGPAARGAGDLPRFLGGGAGAPSETRLQLAMLLAFESRWAHIRASFIAAFLRVDMDEAAACADFAARVLLGVLPTPERVAAAVARAQSRAGLYRIIPQGHVFLDGTYVVAGPPKRADEDWSTYYVGGRNRGAYCTGILSNSDGLVLHACRSSEGRGHGLAMLRGDPPAFGRWLAAMEDPAAPRGSGLVVFHDPGYAGLGGAYPGVTARPRKGYTRRPLTMTKREMDRFVEGWVDGGDHAVARLRRSRALADVHTGDGAELDAHVQLAAGVVNLGIMSGNRRYARLLDELC